MKPYHPLWIASLAAALCASAGCRFMAQNQNMDGVRLATGGQPGVAYNRFQTAAQRDPGNADAFYNLAAVTHQAARQNNDPNLYAQAEQLYNQALDKNPNHVECYRGLAVLLTQTNRPDRATALLQGWAMRAPQLADPRIELARLSIERGDRVSAEQQLTVALRQEPRNPRALAAYGVVREQQGDLRTALASYERAYQADRGFPKLAGHIQTLKNQVGPNPAVAAPGFNPFPVAPGVGVPTTQIATQPQVQPQATPRY